MRNATLLLASALLSAPLAAQGGSIAVRGGKIMKADGSVVENGTLVIENGRISALGGADLEVPFDVILNEYPDAVIFPGFFEAHSSNGMDRANENVPVAPFLNVKDSIDPVSFYFEDELRGGTVAIGIMPGNNTVIGGRGRVVAPAGMTIEQMTLDDGLGMKLAIGAKRGWSRSTQIAELRETFAKLDRDLEALGAKLQEDGKAKADRAKAGDEEDEAGADGDGWDDAGGFVRFGDDFPGKELISEQDLNDGQRGLVAIRNGEERLWVWAPTASDVALANSWLGEYDLLGNSIMVVSSAAWKAADQLAAMGRPVVISGDLWHVERDPVSWKEIRTFAPSALNDAGVEFAIGSVEGRMGPDRLAYQAAMCIREGVSRDVALASVTSRPAKFWGLENDLGDFQEGADGTFVVFDRDPLAADAHVLEVWIRGVKSYDRSEDQRLQRLEEGRLK
ncbi:MAG: amidohydrolase family protein [Planctomycetota bacterium]